MNKFFLIIIVLFCSLAADAQSDKRDYIWLNGYDYNSLIEGNESFIIDFNKGTSPDTIRGLSPITFAGNNASICDREGKLIMYSNGCHIVGADHQIMPNGSEINEGIWIETIKDSCDDYPGGQDVLLLNDPANRESYYLIQKKIIIDDSFFRVLNYSYIEKQQNSTYDVITKNQPIEDSIHYMASYLTSIEHDNRQDWWIAQPRSNSSEIRVLGLNGNGIRLSSIVLLPFSFSENSEVSGSARFSPDGESYALYNPHDNLCLLDFDRKTGELSNLRQLKLIAVPPDAIRGGSVEWSPNSRFMYISAHEDLWQVDTWEDELEDGVVHIDSYNGVSNPFPTRFFMMALAPDCRIYMNSLNGSRSYHVINKPNEKGKACDFVQQGINLPYPSSRGTLPNFPRFRVDEDEKCDPTITSVFGDDIYWRRDLVTYPNPVRDRLTIELPEGKQGKLYVFDTQGQLVWQSTQRYHEPEISLDMSGFATGTYSVEFVPEENKERRLWTSWVVKK